MTGVLYESPIYGLLMGMLAWKTYGTAVHGELNEHLLNKLSVAEKDFPVAE